MGRGIFKRTYWKSALRTLATNALISLLEESIYYIYDNKLSIIFT